MNGRQRRGPLTFSVMMFTGRPKGAFPTGQMPQMHTYVLVDDGISGARKERLAGWLSSADWLAGSLGGNKQNFRPRTRSSSVPDIGSRLVTLSLSYRVA